MSFASLVSTESKREIFDQFGEEGLKGGTGAGGGYTFTKDPMETYSFEFAIGSGLVLGLIIVMAVVMVVGYAIYAIHDKAIRDKAIRDKTHKN